MSSHGLSGRSNSPLIPSAPAPPDSEDDVSQDEDVPIPVAPVAPPEPRKVTLLPSTAHYQRDILPQFDQSSRGSEVKTAVETESLSPEPAPVDAADALPAADANDSAQIGESGEEFFENPLALDDEDELPEEIPEAFRQIPSIAAKQETNNFADTANPMAEPASSVSSDTASASVPSVDIKEIDVKLAESEEENAKAEQQTETETTSTKGQENQDVEEKKEPAVETPSVSSDVPSDSSSVSPQPGRLEAASVTVAIYGAGAAVAAATSPVLPLGDSDSSSVELAPEIVSLDSDDPPAASPPANSAKSITAERRQSIRSERLALMKASRNRANRLSTDSLYRTELAASLVPPFEFLESAVASQHRQLSRLIWERELRAFDPTAPGDLKASHRPFYSRYNKNCMKSFCSALPVPSKPLESLLLTQLDAESNEPEQFNYSVTAAEAAKSEQKKSKARVWQVMTSDPVPVHREYSANSPTVTPLAPQSQVQELASFGDWIRHAHGWTLTRDRQKIYLSPVHSKPPLRIPSSLNNPGQVEFPCPALHGFTGPVGKGVFRTVTNTQTLDQYLDALSVLTPPTTAHEVSAPSCFIPLYANSFLVRRFDKSKFKPAFLVVSNGSLAGFSKPTEQQPDFVIPLRHYRLEAASSRKILVVDYKSKDSAGKFKAKESGETRVCLQLSTQPSAEEPYDWQIAIDGNSKDLDFLQESIFAEKVADEVQADERLGPIRSNIAAFLRLTALRGKDAPQPLVLRNTPLSQLTFSALLAMIRSPNWQPISVVELIDCRLSVADMDRILQTIAASGQTSVRRIDLSFNWAREQRLSMESPALLGWTGLASLQELILDQCALTDRAFSGIIEKSLKSMPKLKVLNLNRNAFSDAGLGPLFLALIKSGQCGALERVSLAENRLTGKSPELQKFLSQTISLKSLDLRGNLIGSTELESICDALEELKEFQELDCSGNPGDQGAVAVKFAGKAVKLLHLGASIQLKNGAKAEEKEDAAFSFALSPEEEFANWRSGALKPTREKGAKNTALRELIAAKEFPQPIRASAASLAFNPTNVSALKAIARFGIRQQV